MRAWSRAPRAPLARLLETIWVFEGPDLPHAREKALPHGRVQLLVNLDGDHLHRDEGKREGRLRDPFGHLWILSKTIREMTADEIRAAIQRFAGG